MEILGFVKTYDWGKTGSSSMVAQLASLNDDKFELDPKGTYAELWMGNHKEGASRVKNSRETLCGIVGKLPYLFKVLSIRRVLSIQIHPNKQQAELLHRERPDIYKDANHKPELAIAITPFVGLCGFRPYKEIYQFCQMLPPLYELLGGEWYVGPLKEGYTRDLKVLFQKLLASDPKEVAKCIQGIRKNHTDVLAANGLLAYYENTCRDFPNDVGILAMFFMNLMKLQPGEAMFLGANEIHAYLSGDCIEAMACSDNIIRAGLTQKPKDVDRLIELLNFEGLPAKSKLFQPIIQDQYTKMFKPPVSEFKVASIRLPRSVDTYNYPVVGPPAIMLVLQGERQLKLEGGKQFHLKKGSIICLTKDSGGCMAFAKVPNSKDSNDFLAYMTMTNF